MFYRLSSFDESEIDCVLSDTVSTLGSGENSGWFVDCDASLLPSYSDDVKIYRPHNGENESDIKFLDTEQR